MQGVVVSYFDHSQKRYGFATIVENGRPQDIYFHEEKRQYDPENVARVPSIGDWIAFDVVTLPDGKRRADQWYFLDESTDAALEFAIVTTVHNRSGYATLGDDTIFFERDKGRQMYQSGTRGLFFDHHLGDWAVSRGDRIAVVRQQFDQQWRATVWGCPDVQ